MAKLNIDNAIETIVSRLETIQTDESASFRSVEIGFRKGREMAAGEYPAAMIGLRSVAIGEQEDCGNALLVCLVRGRNIRAELTSLRAEIADLSMESFDDIQISDVEIGDLFPGYTESAEVEALPDGAFIASWLGIERPTAGFFTTFKITVDAG